MSEWNDEAEARAFVGSVDLTPQERRRSLVTLIVRARAAESAKIAAEILGPDAVSARLRAEVERDAAIARVEELEAKLKTSIDTYAMQLRVWSEELDVRKHRLRAVGALPKNWRLTMQQPDVPAPFIRALKRCAREVTAALDGGKSGG